MKGFAKAALVSLFLASCGCRSMEKPPHVTFYVEVNLNKYGTVRLEDSSEKGITVGVKENLADWIAPAKKK